MGANLDTDLMKQNVFLAFADELWLNHRAEGAMKLQLVFGRFDVNES